jgi:hypothetical protein
MTDGHVLKLASDSVKSVKKIGSAHCKLHRAVLSVGI